MQREDDGVEASLADVAVDAQGRAGGGPAKALVAMGALLFAAQADGLAVGPVRAPGGGARALQMKLGPGPGPRVTLLNFR